MKLVINNVWHRILLCVSNDPVWALVLTSFLQHNVIKSNEAKATMYMYKLYLYTLHYTYSLRMPHWPNCLYNIMFHLRHKQTRWLKYTLDIDKWDENFLGYISVSLLHNYHESMCLISTQHQTRQNKVLKASTLLCVFY